MNYEDEVRNAKAKTQDLTRGALSSGQLDAILKKDSPLMKRARTQGAQVANSRGLLNSSMAAEASMGAMIDRATPLALQQGDAALAQSLENQRATNTMEGRKVDYFANSALQGKEQAFQSGENVLDRDQRSSLLDRELTFTKGENLLDREQRRDLQESEFEFQGTENSLDREQQVDLQVNEFEFIGGQSALDRALTTSQNELDRELQFRLQNNDFSFQEGQSEKDRALTERLQLLDQAFRGDENSLDRILQERLQQNDQEWQTSENEFDRVLQERLQDRAFAQEETILEATQVFDAAQAELTRAFQEDLQENSLASEAALQNAVFAFEQAENVLNRELTREGIAADKSIAQSNARSQRSIARMNNETRLQVEEISSAAAFDRLTAQFENAADMQERDQAFNREMTEIRDSFVLDQMETEFGFDLEKMNVQNDNNINAFALSQYSNIGARLETNVGAVMADPNLTPDQQKNAIADLYDVANSSVRAANQVTETDFPDYLMPNSNDDNSSPSGLSTGAPTGF